MKLLMELLSTILQVAVCTLIPFVVFLFRRDKGVSFRSYIGLTRPTGKSMRYVIVSSLLFVLAGIGLTIIDPDVRQAVLSPVSVTGKLRLMGLSSSTVLTLLLIALVKTSLAEEIFFRGFVAKRLVAAIGFTWGNLAQAAVFGLVHFFLFKALTNATIFPLVVMFLLSGFAGWTIGYIKEKYANGSIIPGWCAHAVGNTISYAVIAFIL